MPRNESNKVQTIKLNGKFIPIYQQCGIVENEKNNSFNLENRCSNKSQDLEYNIDLALNQLCIIERKLGKLIGYEKSQELKILIEQKLKING
jgi:hypothetical protein